MTQVASAEAIHAPFDRTLIHDAPGGPLRLERRGSEFWAEFDDPDREGEGNRVIRQVVMVTGSHRQQVFWYRTGDTRLVGQLPALYLLDERRWVPRQAAFLRQASDRAPSETGRWNRVCIDCHATHGKSGIDEDADLATQSPATSVAEFGIACEACHGPAEQHADSLRNPIRRYRVHWRSQLASATDLGVVNPAKLDARRSSAVCGQCHGVWAFHSEDDQRRAASRGGAYRPGDDLAVSRFVVQPSRDTGSNRLREILADYPDFLRDSFWPDGMVRVSGREYNGLIDSPCYVNATTSERTLACASCHTMHPPPSDARPFPRWAADHQVTAGKEGNGACLQCHPRLQSDLTRHTHHGPDSPGSSCYNCHMPYTSYGLLRGMRSHQVSSPSVSAVLQTGRPDACSLCHLDRSLAWTAGHLDSWYGVAGPPLDADEDAIAASVLWLLRGDAGQRALTAWSMGWEPARRASGSAWMRPFLESLADDPYPAVRLIAERSLRGLPARSGSTVPPAVLLDQVGRPRTGEWRRLLDRRDDRPINLNE